MLNTLRTTLTALTGVVALVPGVLALTKGLGSPPGSRGIFGVLLEVAGGGALSAVLLRKTKPRWPSPIWGIISAVVLITAYFIAFDTAVEKHGYYHGEETPVLIPFLTPRWAPPALDTLVACAQNLPCPSVMADYSAADVAHAITRYGPDAILPLIPPWPRRLTVVVLFLLYAGCIALLVVTFGFWGRRLGGAW